MSKKPDSTDKPDKKQRLKIQAELEDDLIMELHFQSYSLRKIASKVKISHQAVKNRLDKILKRIGTKNDEEIPVKRKVRVKKLEVLQKRAWDFINSKKGEKFAFKYMEIILKTSQEISRLEDEYPNHKEVKASDTLEDVLSELDAKNISDVENDD